MMGFENRLFREVNVRNSLQITMQVRISIAFPLHCFDVDLALSCPSGKYPPSFALFRRFWFSGRSKMQILAHYSFQTHTFKLKISIFRRGGVDICTNDTINSVFWTLVSTSADREIRKSS